MSKVKRGGRYLLSEEEFLAQVERVFARLKRGLTLNKAVAAEEISVEPEQFMVRVRRNPDLAKQYADARLEGYLHMADDILDIADEKVVEAAYHDDVVTLDLSPNVIAHNRMRIDTRKWLMSKCLPKMFGDRVTAEVSGPGGGPIALAAVDLRNLSDDELAAMQAIMGKVSAK